MVPKKALWLPKSSYQVSLLVSLYCCDFPHGMIWIRIQMNNLALICKYRQMPHFVTFKDIKRLIPNPRVEVSDIYFLDTLYRIDV